MRRKWLLIPLILLVVYLLGPSPSTPVYDKQLPVVPAAAAPLEKYISDQEAQHPVKPDNEARIVWANDSLRQKTPYCLLYLHGFSASQAEGAPVHTNLARKFGFNLYLPRMAEQGLDTSQPMLNLTADKYWKSAQEALSIARQLGDKVIVVGTSTGGTLALMLAAFYPDDVYANVLLSPNIEINDPAAWILNNHWGLQLARLVKKSDFVVSEDTRPIYKRYWYPQYRLEGAVALQELLETSMNAETFRKVKQPTLVLYYYKDEKHQDDVVRVSAIREMFSELGTPDDQKTEKAMPNTGNHVIASYIKSNDVEGVEKEITAFVSKITGQKP